jgi:hypothetical protein
VAYRRAVARTAPVRVLLNIGNGYMQWVSPKMDGLTWHELKACGVTVLNDPETKAPYTLVLT